MNTSLAHDVLIKNWHPAKKHLRQVREHQLEPDHNAGIFLFLSCTVSSVVSIFENTPVSHVGCSKRVLQPQVSASTFLLSTRWRTKNNLKPWLVSKSRFTKCKISSFPASSMDISRKILSRICWFTIGKTSAYSSHGTIPTTTSQLSNLLRPTTSGTQESQLHVFPQIFHRRQSVGEFHQGAIQNDPILEAKNWLFQVGLYILDYMIAIQETNHISPSLCVRFLSCSSKERSNSWIPRPCKLQNDLSTWTSAFFSLFQKPLGIHLGRGALNIMQQCSRVTDLPC